MAFENSIGSAMALGTLAHPDTTKVFTNAVMNKQRLDLADEARKAKEAAAAKKLEEDMAGKIKTPSGAYLPYYDKKVNDITNKYTPQIFALYKNGNPLEAKRLEGEQMRLLSGITEQNKEAEKFLESEKSGILVPQETKQLLYNTSSDADAKYQENVKNNPILANFAEYSPTGNLNFKYHKDLKLEDIHQNEINKNKDRAMVLYDKKNNPIRGVKAINGGEQNQLTAEIPEDIMHGISTNLSDDPEYALNLKYKKPELYKEGYQKANPDVDEKLKDKMALDYAVRKQLDPKNSFTHYAPIHYNSGSGKEAPKQVDFQTTNIPRSSSGDYGNIMDSSDGDIIRTAITTPNQGESKPLELPANGFFFIGKDGSKQYVKSTTVKGIPTAVMSSKNSNGGKQGVIEITDVNISPSEYLRKSYEKKLGKNKDDVKIYDDGTKTYAYTGDIKDPNILETYPDNKDIKLKGYIPLTKDNSNKIHSEYSMYGKTDFNGTISKAHGVVIGSGGQTTPHKKSNKKEIKGF